LAALTVAPPYIIIVLIYIAPSHSHALAPSLLGALHKAVAFANATCMRFCLFLVAYHLAASLSNAIHKSLLSLAGFTPTSSSYLRQQTLPTCNSPEKAPKSPIPKWQLWYSSNASKQVSLMVIFSSLFLCFCLDFAFILVSSRWLLLH